MTMTTSPAQAAYEEQQAEVALLRDLYREAKAGPNTPQNIADRDALLLASREAEAQRAYLYGALQEEQLRARGYDLAEYDPRWDEDEERDRCEMDVADGVCLTPLSLIHKVCRNAAKHV